MFLSGLLLSSGRDGTGAVAGAVDEEDFVRAFEDVPTMQVRQAHIRA